ncbi:phage Mu F like family protein [Erwinia sp. 9145]|uniref:phage Mu F like family protein n=1 Tax=Erwinia sp. 9145 TaxID=1500895 RepID=UPI000558595A|nr:phage Mu F like family protein [Erwinia sp. 9145]
MTLNERLRDETIAHSLFVSRYGTGTANRMVKLLNQSDSELTARLLIAMDNLPRDSFTVSRLESLLGSVRQANQKAIESMHAGLTNELLEFAKHESGYQVSLFESLLPEAVLSRYPLTSLSAEMVYAAAMAQPFQGRLLSEWASNLESDRLARISNAVRSGFLLGDTTERIARKVRGLASNDYQDGALQISRANAASITKTAVNHVASVARRSFADANGDIIDSKQWLSTLDNKTSRDCIIRDRLKYTLDGKPVGHKVPYLQGPGRIHFCCRSMETFVTKSWRQLGFNVDEMDAGTRASMDGQVASDTSYGEWLQRQPLSRQIDVLGEKRARLMREGGMRTSEFFSDKGEWLSLEQLRETDSRAFEDAGL